MNKEEPQKDGFIIPARGDRSYRKILREAREGEIIKVRNGVYATPDTSNGCDSQLRKTILRQT